MLVTTIVIGRLNDSNLATGEVPLLVLSVDHRAQDLMIAIKITTGARRTLQGTSIMASRIAKTNSDLARLSTPRVTLLGSVFLLHLAQSVMRTHGIGLVIVRII